MSNETKRNVFGQLLNAYQNLSMKDIQIPDENYRENITTPWNIVYDAAFPDDMPVIPKAQSDWIKQCKANDYSLSFALDDETTPIEVAKTFRVCGGYTYENKDKWLKLQNTFALAWVLGVWRVEETGEIINRRRRNETRD